MLESTPPLFDLRPFTKPLSRLEQAFLDFHKEHPQIYELFVKFAKEAIADGYRQMSSDLILHRIRSESRLSGPKVKLSNDLTAYYARQFIHDHPQHDGLFKLKALRHKGGVA